MKTLYNIILLFLLSFAYPFPGKAQVSINTLNHPAGTALFIEGGNTSVNTEDVVITTIGNLGLGTIAPVSKLHIEGKLFYPVEDPDKDRVLTSDNLGNAEWSFMSFASKTAEWTITNNTANVQFIRGTDILLAGTSQVSADDEIGLTAIPNGVTIPAGRYLCFISGDISGNEYGSLRFINLATSGIVSQVYYGITLSGTAGYLNISTDTSFALYFYATTVPIRRVSDNSLFYLQAPYYAAFSYKVRLLRLD